MPKINDFYANRTSRKACDWGADVKVNANVAADSSMMVDRSRIKTEKRWVVNPNDIDEAKKQGRLHNLGVYAHPVSGSLKDTPVDMMQEVKKNMGQVMHGTVYRDWQGEKPGGKK